MDGEMEGLNTGTQEAPLKRTRGPNKRSRTRSPEKRNRTRGVEAVGVHFETVKGIPAEEVPALRQKGNPYQLKDTWALIRLAPSHDPKELKEVPLNHNGFNIQVQKGKWVPVNWVFVDKLEQAEIPVYSNEPGQQREPMGHRSRFDFQGPYKISEQQYKDLSKIAKVRDITPEEITAIVGFPVR
jgi:hypothetical protein